MRTKFAAAPFAVLPLMVIALLSLASDASTFWACEDGRYQVQYFRNPDLQGPPALTRCEGSRIDSDWGEKGPTRVVTTGGGGDPKADSGSSKVEEFVGRDNFSVRWTGRFRFNGGRYIFTARADDGIRVWIDGRLIIDEWRDQPDSTFSANWDATSGMHTVRVEYYERDGGAIAEVSWAAATH